MQKGEFPSHTNVPPSVLCCPRLDSTLPCFAALGEQTAQSLRERFQPALTHSLVGEYVDRLIVTSLGSAWTRLYDSVCVELCSESEVLTPS